MSGSKQNNYFIPVRVAAMAKRGQQGGEAWPALTCLAAMILTVMFAFAP